MHIEIRHIEITPNELTQTRPPENVPPRSGPDEPELIEPGLKELDRPGFIKWASTLWGIPLERGQTLGRIHGSPERSMSRGVARDTSGQRYLVEKFPLDNLGRKENIARTLAALSHKGLEQILVPEKSLEGPFLSRYGDAVFQVTRFVGGSDLPRPEWLASGERGAAMAGFLTDMGRCARDLSSVSPFFSIKGYIIRLFDDMAVQHPDRYGQYLAVYRFLEKGFMGIHDRLPAVFCHGDFHPINVIWQGEAVKAVIDWEFTGCKPECYDAANLLGCAGIEHPEGLVMPMATTFLARLHRGGAISPLGWRWLPEFVLALRFAWLAEWLRKEDREMLDTEFRFMKILMTHAEDLREIWANAHH